MIKLNKIYIPKRFMSHGTFVEVFYKDNLTYQRNRVGEAHLRSNEIWLQKSNDGIPRKQEQIEETFFHELMHHIFDKIHRSELSDDEVLVDNCGSLLYQIFKTMEFENEADKPEQKQERSETLLCLRGLCKDFGDNDWPNELHLADIIEKHLGKYLYENQPTSEAGE